MAFNTVKCTDDEGFCPVCDAINHYNYLHVRTQSEPMSAASMRKIDKDNQSYSAGYGVGKQGIERPYSGVFREYENSRIDPDKWWDGYLDGLGDAQYDEMVQDLILQKDAWHYDVASERVRFWPSLSVSREVYNLGVKGRQHVG